MVKAKRRDVSFGARLGLTDFTLLVVGAIIGDGIYVVASMGASSLGPAQLVAWLVAGVLAAFIALAFIQCAAIHPDVGGSYSYARSAFGPFVGFIAGWTLYVGEWLALSAFPLAFFNYFRALTDAPSSLELPVKLTLIAAVTTVNLAGVRQGAKTNDVLTVAKLLPLALLAVLGVAYFGLHFSAASSHLSPFTPLGWSGFGAALLPIFWAYAGFELAVLPAGEVATPGRNLPRGLIIGVGVATLFYLLVSFAVVVGARWEDVAASHYPLASVMAAMLGSLGGPAGAGARLMSFGGLVSIAGVFVVFTLGLARLSYALAVDGFLPAAFGKLHPRYGTPYFGILFQAASAVVFSTLFDLRALLSTAVLFLSLCYLLTALSAVQLVRHNPQAALHLPGLRSLLALAVLSSVVLTAQATLEQALVAMTVVGLGIGIYAVHGRRWQAAANQRDERRVGLIQRLAAGEHHLNAWLQHAVRRPRFD